jgi:hypothetical protein
MEENEFWLKFWTVLAVVVIVITSATYYYHKNESILRMEAWVKCVEAGGQPISQPMLGTEIITFTCLRK